MAKRSVELPPSAGMATLTELHTEQQIQGLDARIAALEAEIVRLDLVAADVARVEERLDLASEKYVKLVTFLKGLSK